MHPIPTHDKLLEILRRTAKKDYWQSIYNVSKETQGLCIFKNHTDFTQLQIYFLGQIAFYSGIYFDIAMGEVGDIVLDNETYEDSYSFYKSKKREKEKKAHKKSYNTQPKEDNKYHKNSQEVLNQNQWVFTKVKGSK